MLILEMLACFNQGFFHFFFYMFSVYRTTHYSGENSLSWSSTIALLVWQCIFSSDTTRTVNQEVSFLT